MGREREERRGGKEKPIYVWEQEEEMRWASQCNGRKKKPVWNGVRRPLCGMKGRKALHSSKGLIKRNFSKAPNSGYQIGNEKHPSTLLFCLLSSLYLHRPIATFSFSPLPVSDQTCLIDKKSWEWRKRPRILILDLSCRDLSSQGRGSSAGVRGRGAGVQLQGVRREKKVKNFCGRVIS